MLAGQGDGTVLRKHSFEEVSLVQGSEHRGKTWSPMTRRVSGGSQIRMRRSREGKDLQCQRLHTWSWSLQMEGEWEEKRGRVVSMMQARLGRALQEKSGVGSFQWSKFLEMAWRLPRRGSMQPQQKLFVVDSGEGQLRAEFRLASVHVWW